MEISCESAGMVWCGIVWYGMVWYGMVWYGMVWYGMGCIDVMVQDIYSVVLYLFRRKFSKFAG